MAIFNKHDDKQETVKRTSETTVVANGAKLKGEFEFDCRLHVDGVIEGVINSNNIVVVGKRGCMRGDLKAERLVVNGTFEGSADCTKVEVLTQGVFNGEVTSEELIIESKAKFQGQSKLRVESKDVVEPEDELEQEEENQEKEEE